MQKLILYLLLLTPLFLTSQRLNNNYFCYEYQYIDLIDNNNDFTKVVDLLISFRVEDDYSGSLQIKTASGQLLSNYFLDGIKAFREEEASAILFENCKLQNEKTDNIYSIYIYDKNDNKFKIIILLKDKNVRHYKKLNKQINKT